MSIQSVSHRVATTLIQAGAQCGRAAHRFSTGHPQLSKAIHCGLCVATTAYFGQSLLGKAVLLGATHTLLTLGEKGLSIIFPPTQSQRQTTLAIEKTALDDLETLFASSSLKSLSLNECTLSDKAVSCIAEEIKKNQLTYLNLSYIQFSEAQIEVLAEALLHNHSLTECRLSFCIPDDNCLDRVVKSLVQHPAIRTLHLESNAVLKPGMVSLAHLIRSNPVIEHLVIAYQTFQDLGSEHLVISLQENHSLKSLDLSSNAMTQESYDQFQKISEERSSLKIRLPETASSFPFFQ